MRLGVLGRLEVCVGDEALELGGARQRTLLALLTANAGRVTDLGALVPPGNARRTARTYVSRLRRSLAPAAAALAVDELIVTRPAGYLLRLPPEVVDAARFEQLVAAGRAAAEPAVSAERLSAALALWRGDAYGEFPDVPLLRAEAARLQALRLGAVEDRVDAELAAGAGSGLVEELTTLTEQHPGHDRLWGQLMIALCRAGRHAEALDVFVRARTVLAERFGLDPPPRLAEIHRQVLANDPGLAAPTHPAPVRAGPPLVRNYLPGDIADFAGRRTELARLLAEHAGGTARAVVVEAFDGMAGVGKTTLAVHAAHRLAGRYPDAQLFIDLHGHTPRQQPVAPIAALDALLRALGVPGERIPTDLDARAARWRAELASRSVLVLLDNAADAAQVRPLLPGTARSLTLITSRRRLVDLETTHVESLDVLDEDEAVALFTGIVGAGRVTGRTEAVREVVARCGHLPLAIRIAAARLRSRPAWTVRHLADRLRQTRLAELSAGDRSVAAAFALSYEHLDAARQRMFRLLGVHPGPDIDAGAAAALAAVDPAEAGRLLESLVDDHLLQQPTAGRYRLHDLVRQHARTVALTDEPDPARRDALHRVTDFYLHTAYRASRLIDRQYPPIDIGAPAEGLVAVPLADDGAAMAWFDANHHCVLAARASAEEAGRDTAVWQLAWTLDNFHYRRGYIHDNIASWLAGLAAAERLGDVAAQARAHRRLGLVYAPIGRHGTALRHLERSLALSEETGDLLGQAGVHFVLALAWTHQDDHQRALTAMTSARNLYREVGDSRWEVRALSAMGACHTRLGHPDQARDYCESALELCRRHGDVYGEADSLANLGRIAAGAGRTAEALRHHEEALATWRHLDHTYRQAGTLTDLGDLHHSRDDHDRARHAWQQAVALYRAQNLETAAAGVEERLGLLAPSAGDAPVPPARPLLDRAHASLSRGRLAEASALFDRAADAAREERNPSVFAEAALGLGGMWVNKYRGRADRARVLARLDEALAALPETDTVPRHRLATRRAAEHAYGGGGEDEVLAALDEARRLGDRQALAEALSLAHHALLRPEHGERRLAMADELIAVASAAGLEMLTLTGVCRRTVDLFHLGDPRAERSLTDLRRRGEGCRGMLFLHAAMEVMLLVRAGHLARAEERAVTCLRLGTEAGDTDAPVFHSTHLFAIRWLQGRGAELVDLAEHTANSPTLPDTELSFHATLALLASDAGQQDRARSALHRLTAGGLAAIPRSSTWLACMFSVVEAAAALSEPSLAREAYDLLTPFAHLPVVPSMAIVCFGSVERPLGLAALTFGDLDLAVAHLDRAVTANIRLANRPLTACARADLAGALLRRGGDRARAAELLDLAIAEATAMGMTARADAWRFTRRSLSQPITISRDGERWRLAWHGRAVLVDDLVGMRYLARLVAHPGTEIPALDLVTEFDHATQPTNHTVLDARARAAYARRARALTEELADARWEADQARVERLEQELDALTTEVQRHTGLNGRPRHFGSPAERARTAVRKAITRAIDAVDAAEPEAADALRSTVTTGYRCAYSPHAETTTSP
jgi:DNA-binding SARP family transcriptional activator/tetratricopeptide (TPR) repeat protein